MTSDQPVATTTSSSRTWPILALPRPALTLLTVVELLAGTLLVGGVLGLVRTPPPQGVLLLTVLLTSVAVAHIELSVRAERMRRRIAETRYVDMTSVWTLTGAVLLPATLACAVVVTSFGYSWWRVSRPAGTPAHRQLYSVTTVVLAIHAVAALHALTGTGTQWTFREPVDVAMLVAAILVYAATNILLVAGIVRLARPGTRFLAVLLGGDIWLELSTLSLGALVSVVLDMTTPWMLLLAMAPLLALEQTTLVRQLEERADTDAKTGLLNPAAWRLRAEQLLERSRATGRAAAVLILDLDHFKALNDRYGHLAGDDALAAVAEVVRREVREQDHAGRFGGEEFVVALGGLRHGADDARDVAERIRAGVAALAVDSGHTATPLTGLSVSAGIASAHRGSTLDTLLGAADAALYVAKGAGRNQVRASGEFVAPPCRFRTPANPRPVVRG
ncbi:GGDEF domain-containing protein [Pseudonocardia phyllosphaerae]|uniref:GGDEF domain-containing protein n=1 Tax=Pseudonocardia phyllosphaerae TaxID=3390502 RepID=UPI00397D568C